VNPDPWKVPEWHLAAAGPMAPMPLPEPVVRWRDDGRELALTVLALVFSAPLVGLLWSALGPKLPLRPALSGSETAFRTEVGADVHFVIVTAAAGVICAIVAIALKRDGPGVVVGLGIGGVLAALVTNRVGYLVNRDHTLSALHHLGVSLSLLDKFGIDPFFKVRAVGVLMAWPLAALLTYLLALAIRGPRSLP
jgi:hypothetical protein